MFLFLKKPRVKIINDIRMSDTKVETTLKHLSVKILSGRFPTEFVKNFTFILCTLLFERLSFCIQASWTQIVNWMFSV